MSHRSYRRLEVWPDALAPHGHAYRFVGGYWCALVGTVYTLLMPVYVGDTCAVPSKED